MSNRNTTASKAKPALHRWARMAALLLLMILPGLVMAEDQLPFESNLTMITNALTGPIAFGISIVGIVAAGAILIFGGELSGFLRTLVFLVLVISLIVNSATIVRVFRVQAADPGLSQTGQVLETRHLS
ncbi:MULTISPECIES: TrbC/VirB2 family protein [Dyella]|uniref:Conjugal transfer protein TrbC n=2 Tax=Dyella TaxID=231454 RepID=A0A4R0YHU6_9GAMM|nr:MULTISPECIES: TrbC/VirB2 family protein [Dyella]TBR36909.1 conjugal transfer protein TrbC [Dyella terrae]TCI08000.1 conjugal transfer protein TrbC [Dyella soli]